jgi:hypothetical protein
MVENWLTKYMFSGDPTTAAAKAKSVADELSDYESFGSHGRRVDRDRLRAMGLTAVTDLEDDQHLQDLVLSVHHAINHTMNMVGLLKIVENHEGKAFIRRNQGMVFQVPMAPGAPQVPTRLGVPAPAPPANRQQQREQERKQRKKGR